MTAAGSPAGDGAADRQESSSLLASRTLDDAADNLSGSAFLHFRSGALFSFLSYLTIAGLVTLVLGFEQGENYDQLSAGVITLGWCVVAVPVCGYAVMLWRLMRFLRALSCWVSSTIRQDPEAAPKTWLEARLAMNSFVRGAFVFPPFGFICPFLALIAALIGWSDDHGPHASVVVACLAATTAITVFWCVVALTIPLGIGHQAGRLGEWRTRPQREAGVRDEQERRRLSGDKKFRLPEYGASAGLAILLAAYMLLVPLYVLFGGIVWVAVFHRTDFNADILWWPLPCIFPVGSLLMVADMTRGAMTHRTVKSKFPVMALCSAFLAMGSFFGLSSHNNAAVVPVIICCGVTVAFIAGSIPVPHRRHKRTAADDETDAADAPRGR